MVAVLGSLDDPGVIVALVALGFSGLVASIIVRLGFYDSLTGSVIAVLQPLFFRVSILKDPRSKGPFAPVPFCVKVEGAARVYLAGTFNEWLRANHIGGRITADQGFRLRECPPGVWQISLRILPPGSRLEYAFVADFGTGYWQWLADPKCESQGPHSGFSEATVGTDGTLVRDAVRKPPQVS